MLSAYSFFFNYTSTPDIYSLSLHDALPISYAFDFKHPFGPDGTPVELDRAKIKAKIQRNATNRPDTDTPVDGPDRKSTRLNSSHANISYAVFCLKKKKNKGNKYKRSTLHR